MLPQLLQYANFSHNQLAGTLPALPPSIMQLDISSNKLSGPLPVPPSSLRSLLARSNRLTGNASGISPGRLQELLLGGNALEGGLPAGLFRSGSLQVLELAANMLNSTLPGNVQATSLLRLDLSRNVMSGGCHMG
jgi:hypothetical protein